MEPFMPTNQIAMLAITALVVIGFGCVFIAWMVWPPEAAQSNVISALVGALTTGYLQVINYWFSNRSSP
jgi:uncharacterized protein YggT (Ycf19 family)